jgi:coenzyme F420-reducing hydrogenase delta subunit
MFRSPEMGVELAGGFATRFATHFATLFVPCSAHVRAFLLADALRGKAKNVMIFKGCSGAAGQD